MTRVKICGITRVEDALTAAQSGADAIGLVFYPGSPRHVSVSQAAMIMRALPPFITSVGLFVNAEAQAINAILQDLPLALLQFHGDESASFCRQFKRPYLKAVRVQPSLDLLQYAADYPDAQGLLLDTYVDGIAGGTGQTFDWDLIPAGLPLPVVLSGGLNPNNVAAAIKHVKPWAVDVSSGVEAAKGIKDAAKIAAFMRGVNNGNV